MTITLQNPAGARLDLHPTGEGAFEAIGLKPDSYSVSVDVPGTTRAYYGPTSIELEDRACAPIGVNVEATFSVRASLFVGQRQTASAEITMSLAEEPVSEVKLVLKPR